MEILIADSIFQKFESFAGAIVNITSKSKILGIGGFQGHRNWPFPWLKVEEKLKIFGIYICPSYQQILSDNWSELLNKFRGKLYS